MLLGVGGSARGHLLLGYSLLSGSRLVVGGPIMS